MLFSFLQTDLLPCAPGSLRGWVAGSVAGRTWTMWPSACAVWVQSPPKPTWVFAPPRPVSRCPGRLPHLTASSLFASPPPPALCPGRLPPPTASTASSLFASPLAPVQAPGPFDVVILDLMHQSLLQALQLLAHPAEAQVRVIRTLVPALNLVQPPLHHRRRTRLQAPVRASVTLATVCRRP